MLPREVTVTVNEKEQTISMDDLIEGQYLVKGVSALRKALRGYNVSSRWSAEDGSWIFTLHLGANSECWTTKADAGGESVIGIDFGKLKRSDPSPQYLAHLEATGKTKPKKARTNSPDAVLGPPPLPHAPLPHAPPPPGFNGGMHGPPPPVPGYNGGMHGPPPPVPPPSYFGLLALLLGWNSGYGGHGQQMYQQLCQQLCQQMYQQLYHQQQYQQANNAEVAATPARGGPRSADGSAGVERGSPRGVDGLGCEHGAKG